MEPYATSEGQEGPESTSSSWRDQASGKLPIRSFRTGPQIAACAYAVIVDVDRLTQLT